MKPTNTKYEKNWTSKTIENLEKDYWDEPTYDSKLVKTCHQLRKKPLVDFEIEDLRIMISQNNGLKYLIPLALETLRDNVLAEGDFFEGDLLKAVINCDRDFWNNEKELFNKLEVIISQNEEILERVDPDLLEIYRERKEK